LFQPPVLLSKMKIDVVLGHEVQHLEREKAFISSFRGPSIFLGSGHTVFIASSSTFPS